MSFKLAYVAAQVGFSLDLLETLQTHFHNGAHFSMQILETHHRQLGEVELLLTIKGHKRIRFINIIFDC